MPQLSASKREELSKLLVDFYVAQRLWRIRIEEAYLDKLGNPLFVHPNAYESALFMAEEVGELVRAMRSSRQSKWVRANENYVVLTGESAPSELCDLAMMACTYPIGDELEAFTSLIRGNVYMMDVTAPFVEELFGAVAEVLQDGGYGKAVKACWVLTHCVQILQEYDSDPLSLFRARLNYRESVVRRKWQAVHNIEE